MRKAFAPSMPSKSLHSINSATYPSHNSPTNSTDEPFVINVDGTGFARLDAGTARSDEFTHPAWSPDGSKIACHGRSTLNGMTYCDDVFVMNPDGSETTSLTQSDCSFSDDRPSWSPDGTRVVFGAVHSGPDVTLSVRTVDIIDANGESRIHLTDGSDPAWSPDGSKIAYLLGDDIWSIDVDGGTPQNLTNSPDIPKRSPAWTPTGEQISFYSNGAIYEMNTDGMGLRPLIDVMGFSFDFSWSPVLNQTVIDAISWGRTKEGMLTSGLGWSGAPDWLRRQVSGIQHPPHRPRNTSPIGSGERGTYV